MSQVRGLEEQTEVKMIVQELLRGLISGTSLQTSEEGTSGQRRKSKVELPQRPMVKCGAGMIIQIVWIEARLSDFFYPCSYRTEVSIDKVSPLWRENSRK